jgi:hypothetical protein
MKKILVLVAIAGTIAGVISPQVSTAQQKKAVYVQGHLHEYLTNKAQKGQLKYREGGGGRLKNTTDNIDFSQVQCWAGYVDPNNVYPIDSAVLVVKWTGDEVVDRDSILVFGYKWSTLDTSGYAVTKYTIDMIRAVANSSCRFSALLQNTGRGNFTVGGFGYNTGRTSGRTPIVFRLGSAARDSRIRFQYTGTPNCAMGQFAIPYLVSDPVTAAWNKANGSGGTSNDGTGIIDHPFNADYGYPAYDYDYWALSATTETDYYWQAGWYDNYWTFYIKNQPAGTFSTAPYGIVDRQLENGYVDGFVFNSDPLAWPPVKDMSGDYISPSCNCGCVDAASPNAKRK